MLSLPSSTNDLVADLIDAVDAHQRAANAVRMSVVRFFNIIVYGTTGSAPTPFKGDTTALMMDSLLAGERLDKASLKHTVWVAGLQPEWDIGTQQVRPAAIHAVEALLNGPALPDEVSVEAGRLLDVLRQMEDHRLFRRLDDWVRIRAVFEPLVAPPAVRPPVMWDAIHPVERAILTALAPARTPLKSEALASATECNRSRVLRFTRGLQVRQLIVRSTAGYNDQPGRAGCGLDRPARTSRRNEC